MGSAVGCLKKSKPNENPLLKDKIVLSVRPTFSNDSSSSAALSLNQLVPNNFRSEFNWSRIQTIYLGCPSALNDDLNLTLPMVRSVERLFETVERDLVINAKKIHLCLSFLGRGLRDKHRVRMEHSDNDFLYKDVDDKILAHIISYVKFHRMLLRMFGHDINEARRCLNLLAYSHSTMNITQTDFRMFDIAVEKFLLKFNVVDDDTLKIAVSYFNLITNYICNYIRQNNDNVSLNQLISLDDTLRRRENSRQLRKWNRLVGKLRYDTCPYIEEALDINITETLPDTTTQLASGSTKHKELCPLSNLDCIFRNYNKR